MPKPDRYTIAVDFDGVIHSYTSGWNDDWASDPIAKLDPPVEGAIDWLMEMVRDFEVVIFTTRGADHVGANAVMDWLGHHGYRGPALEVTAHKPPALVYLDDRAIRFEGPGTFPTRQQIHDARPWNKKGA